MAGRLSRLALSAWLLFTALGPGRDALAQVQQVPAPLPAPVQLVCLRDANGQVTGTTDATVFPGSSCTIPANALTAGRALSVVASVVVDAQGGVGSTFTVRLGGTPLFDLTGLTQSRSRRLVMVIIAVDATTVFTQAMYELDTGGAAQSSGFTGVVTVPDLTAADRVLDMQITPGAGTDDHTLRYYRVALEQL